MKEPAWKTALNWGTVIVFFSLPLVIFVTQLWVYPTLEQEKVHLDYLRNFMNNITILVFGLAGLRTWESIRANGRAQPPQNNKEWKPSEPKTLESKV